MSEQNSNSALQAFAVPLSIVAAGAIIGICLIVALKGSSGGTAAVAPGQPQPSVPVNVKELDLDNHPYIGNKNAPVTLVSWEDYECPFCKRFEMEVLPSIISQYVDTGKVRVVFKDYQFLGENSVLGGEWGRAVWKLYPTKYWAWREAHYKNQPPEHQLTAAQYEAHLAKMATQVGIDAAKLKADITANKSDYAALLAADQAEATKYGINGTPGFVTGEIKIDGAQPLQNFVAAINSQL